jgi:phosphoribosyl-ATP pyrophosphohydrolase/phosphoribosyl-AMP cyclohydrolase
MLDLDRLNFDRGNGLVTVVAQDARSGAVLMVAHADREALERTVATGEMHYRSRSRGLWRKGETSGNVQRVVALLVDCDGDAVLARVEPAGPACHTGAPSCFGALSDVGDVLGALDGAIARRAAEDRDAGGPPPDIEDDARGGGEPHRSRAPTAGSTQRAPRAGAAHPPSSYTRRLLADRNLRLKKIGEESAELIAACADGDRERAVAEAADLVYHALVALRSLGGSLDDVRRELAARRR